MATQEVTPTATNLSRITPALARISELCADPLLQAKLRGLLRAYDAKWGEQELMALEIEALTVSDLYNPATQAKSRSFIMAGKKDVLIEEGGLLWLMDHKTCSEDITDPNAPYWRQLVIEGQHLHYALLEHLNGRRIEGAIWDVARKPTISPKQIAKADQRFVVNSGRYFTQEVTDEDIREMQISGRETHRMYEMRLFYDATRERPEFYFQRQRIARLDGDLLEYATELWGHTQDLLICRRENRWPRTSGACMAWGRPCVFLGVCSGHDSIESQNWRKKEWVHNELPIFNNGDARGCDVLTNSRIKTFQQCRRKHQYQYELGIERVEQEDIETLQFGTVWHEALATYFEPYKKVR